MNIKLDTLICTVISAGCNAIAIAGFDPIVTKFTGVIGAMSSAVLLFLKQTAEPPKP